MLKKVLLMAAVALLGLPGLAHAQLGRGEISVGYGVAPVTDWIDAYIIGKTKCDGIQNQMRLFGGRVSPKRKATKISHTHTKKHRSNGF